MLETLSQACLESVFFHLPGQLVGGLTPTQDSLEGLRLPAGLRLAGYSLKDPFGAEGQDRKATEGSMLRPLHWWTPT